MFLLKDMAADLPYEYALHKCSVETGTYDKGRTQIVKFVFNIGLLLFQQRLTYFYSMPADLF